VLTRSERAIIERRVLALRRQLAELGARLDQVSEALPPRGDDDAPPVRVA
jgi:hypothetical protein